MVDTDPKVLKKQSKARAKAEKKRAKVLIKEGRSPETVDSPREGSELSAAERSAAAAERQVVLNRWRVAVAVVSALVALASLIILLWK